MQANSAAADILHLPARAVVLGRVRQMRQALYGETALFPVTPSGDLDQERLAVEGFDFHTGNLDSLSDADLPRLGVLVDTFKRFIPEAPLGVRIAVLDRGGDVQVEQIDHLEPYPAATEMVRNAIRTGIPLLAKADVSRSMAVALAGAAWTLLPAERFDEICARLEQQYPQASDKRIERMATREIHSHEVAAAASALRIPHEAADDILERLPTLDPAVWAGKPVPRREWFLPGLIPARTVTLLSGDGGTGKSLLAHQLGVASALGVSTAGLHPTEGKVLYLAAEDDADELHRRTVDIVTALGGDLADLAGHMLIAPLADQDATLAAPGRDGVLLFTRLHAALERLVETFAPGFVILDTAADLFAGDEIKRNQVRTFIAALRKLALRTDCAVLLLAHPSVSGMQSGTGTSGSTGWSNSVRSRLYLTRPTGDGEDPNARELTVMKSNYGAVGDKVRVRWEAGAFVADSLMEPAMMGVINKKVDDLFVALLSKFNRLGQRVGVSTGTSYAPAKMAKHDDARGFNKRQLEQAMQRLLEAGTIRLIWEGPPSHQRQKLIVTADDFGPDRIPSA
ncbi:AAA family ATPase [Ancylobacter vacuolatus]|uniref:RecA-family ATPase n=1 Tax=Ancylobacter vacuolatus TaxID=223389 RepID=A0ABU0DIZ5_9HYPH|nr:AAA family ATPase [Ancylobacter vacuolatus]MDQ0348389.1 RecA-family ATPase [Ancylobacter vacuolatus]